MPSLLFLISIIVFLCLIKLYLNFFVIRCKSLTCLVGKTVIVTGANTGIGYETAFDFAKRGARVILACRNKKKAQEACKKIINETGNTNIVIKLIDLSCFNSVRVFAQEIYKNEDRLDILVNNAAVLEVGLHSMTANRQLLLMQVNYFSPFLLTNLLLDLMKKTGSSRIVNVSSVMARFAFNFNVDKVGNTDSYSNSKLCLIMFTRELAKRLKGTEVTVYSADPGLVNTEIFKQTPTYLKMVARIFKSVFFKTPEEGAQTTIFCSVAKNIEQFSGENFVNCQKIEKYKTVKEKESEKLWEITREIVGGKSDKM